MSFFTNAIGLVVAGLLATGCGLGPAAGTVNCVNPALTTSSGSELGLNSSVTQNALAQSLIPTADSKVVNATLRLFRTGSPTPANGNVTLSLESDSSGNPSGTVLASSTLSLSGITATTATDYIFYLSQTVSLKAGSTYWLVLSGGYTNSSSDLINWAANDGTAGYTSGHPAFYTGTAWSTGGLGARDLIFILWC